MTVRYSRLRIQPQKGQERTGKHFTVRWETQSGGMWLERFHSVFAQQHKYLHVYKHLNPESTYEREYVSFIFSESGL